MTVWKRAMDYLGLGPDDAYDDYDMPPVEPDRPICAPRGGYDEPRAARPGRGANYGYDEPESPVRTPAARTLLSRDLEPVPARPRLTVPDDSGITPRPARQGSAVRSYNSSSPEPYCR